MKLRQSFFCLLALSTCSVLAFTAAAQNAPRPDASGPRDIDLSAQDGTKLKATYYAAAKPGPGIMLFHQCTRDRTAWTNFATQLAAKGFHVMTLDYRGYGQSGGERAPNITAQERQRWVREVWPADIDIAFGALLKQPGVNREYIGAAGASCGAGQSIQFARRHSNVKTIALLSGGTGASNQDRDYLEYAGWMPLLMAASRDDGGIVASMRWLMGFSGNPQNKFVEYQAAGHGTDMFAVEKGLEPAIIDWFDVHLRRSPVQRTSASAAARAPLGPSAAFWKLLEEPGGAARARKIFDEAKKKDPAVILFPEAEMNALGYGRLQGGQVEEALQLFEMNVAAYPESANVYDSLGDAYLAAGKVDLAMEYARKALQKLETDRSLNDQGRQAIRDSAEQKLRDRMPAVLTIAGMDAVTVRSDVTYKSVAVAGSPRELKADIYIPAGAKAADRFPAVVLISGGGIEGGPGRDWRDAGVYVSYGRLLAASGFVGVPFSKRYARGPEGIAHGESDLRDLIGHLREHAAEYNINPDRLAVWAFSGGGLLLGMPLRDTPPYIRAIVSYYAIMGVPSQVPEQERARFDQIAPLSVLRRATAPLPPIFIARAGLDNPGLNEHIDAFVKEANARNVKIEFHNHAHGRHGFDIIDPNDRSREIIRATLDFLRAHLR